MVLALNTVSGQVSDVSPKMLVHPHFGQYLVAVKDGAKPYLPEMYKGGTVEQKVAQKSKIGTLLGKLKSDNEEPEAEEVTEAEETQQPDIDIEDEK